MIAMLVGSCALEAAPETTSSTEQSVIWNCSGASMWTRSWRVDNVEVGHEDCQCDGSVLVYGSISGHYQQFAGPSCW
jgi:hypothetical protein